MHPLHFFSHRHTRDCHKEPSTCHALVQVFNLFALVKLGFVMNIRPTIIWAIIGDMVGSFYSSKEADTIDFSNLRNYITVTEASQIIIEIAEIVLFLLWKMRIIRL